MLLITSCSTSISEEYASELEFLPENIDFNIYVKPILSDKCYSCHGPDKGKREAGLNLDNADDAYASLVNNSGKVAIRPGSLSASEAYHRIISEDSEYMMPPPDSHLSLSNQEKAILMKWIEDGAEYKPHWAFIKPELRMPPAISTEITTRNAIDNFIIERLDREGLLPSPESEKEVLLRRMSFDLTGLPPSQEEIRNFLNDGAPNAYEKQVDRLLNSPHYGERMAMDWLDVARYSDTHGYQADMYRDVSPWRDWVIDAFNDNLPYDRFLTWQLAGDLLPNATREQTLATAFLRLHPQNAEGGIVDEEYRVEYVSDRVSVLGTGLMGLSLACAKCHDHKFDPISQKNYFELFGFFNNVNESGQISWDGSMPVPTLTLPTEEQEEVIAFYKSLEAKEVAELTSLNQAEEAKAEEWIHSGLYKSALRNSNLSGAVAHFNLNDNLVNKLNTSQVGEMKRVTSNEEKPKYIEGYADQGLLLDGDAWLDLGGVGRFRKKDDFSIGIMVNIPEELSEGVIFHKCNGAKLYNFKGYHLYLIDNKLELVLAHTYPDNAIVKKTIADVPKEQWIHLMMTYDGSSKGMDLRLFMNGEEVETDTEVDNLYKDIVFSIDPARRSSEPGLQIGARWRGVGINGAVVDDIKVYNTELSALDVMRVYNPDAIGELVQKEATELDESERLKLKQYYKHHYSKPLQTKKTKLSKTRSVLFDSLEHVKEIMVMREMETPRKAYILERGVYDSYGEEVFANVPESLNSWDANLPKNRLGLATWLTDPDHPLTARVAVNRYWQNYFGQGLVRTTEDFGNQGEMPSHPELLDWLALEFINSDWDVKALQKLIVMSHTYRQSSATSNELRELDPDNILLARGPSMRLSSEMMRDNALAASDLLVKKIGGESVRPYQPEGLWSMNTGTYVQDQGEDLYRRSLYTLWKRTVPNPTLYTFDQPDREVCTVRRQKTNTPLQALVLLNDPTYLEAAKVIGETMAKHNSKEEGIALAYNKVTGRKIDSEQLEVLLKLQEVELKKFESDKNRSKGWLEAGAYTIDKSLDKNYVAANAVVASVMLNSDAVISKR